MHDDNSSNALVNWDHFSDIAAGEPAEMQKLAQLYIETFETSLRQLEEAVADNDAERVKQVAHTALGASTLLGIIGVVSLLKEMEHLGERRDVEGARKALPELQKTFRLVSECLGIAHPMKKSRPSTTLSTPQG